MRYERQADWNRDTAALQKARAEEYVFTASRFFRSLLPHHALVDKSVNLYLCGRTNAGERVQSGNKLSAMKQGYLV